MKKRNDMAVIGLMTEIEILRTTLLLVSTILGLEIAAVIYRVFFHD